MVIEGMTYKQIEKNMAAMRKDVLAWKKQLKQENGRVHRNSALYENFKTFDHTFKAARSVLDRPENDFPAMPKRGRLDTLYSELQGWYSGIQFLMREKPEMKTETEIKPSKEGSAESKKETEIKRDNEPEKSTKKKETKIKGEQMQISIRGGRRAGAGRKSLGVKKPVSITLPEQVWNEIDNLIQNEKYRSYADYFRSLILDGDSITPEQKT